jgi:DNA polymerase/3'-5' exonuclease PolX
VSDTATRHDLADAEAVAASFIALLAGTYDRLEIAGSVRRKQETVKDIELVAVPTVEPLLDLFDNPYGRVDLLDHRLGVLRDAGTVEPRRRGDGSTAWGPKTKYLRWGGFPIDLFAVDAARRGWILALRTGPAAFSRQLVVPVGSTTKDGRPGLLPGFLKPRDGWLTYRASAEPVPTPEEDDVWRLFDITPGEPWERT